MALKLYTIALSIPCRSVYLTERALGISLDHHQVDVIGGDDQNKSAEIFKLHIRVWKNEMALEREISDFIQVLINPQHTVPTLDDNGFIFWDSHAINAYLVDQYGKDDSLYPKDRKRRTVKPIRLGLTKTVPDEKREYAIETYDFLEAFLNGNDWVVPGEGVTIADFNLITTITSMDFLVPIDLEKYPNIKGWIERAQALPYYDANQKGLDDFNTLFKRCLEGA